MNKKLKIALDNVYEQLGRSWFFVATLVLFFLHAAWLALSSNLLPYDEYYHIGIIKYYSHQWSSFITHQTADVSYLGDITRLPSYLYHYLMSFPYRFFHLFTQNETILIILLRFINIGLVIGGVVLFRRLFIKGGLSKRLVNVVCAFFLLTPFVVMLAAENNYDNLMFFMTPIFLWLAYNLVRKQKPSSIDAILFLSIGLLTCLVKHSFIVIFGVTVCYVAWVLLKNKAISAVSIKQELQKKSKLTLFTAGAIFMVAALLFTERHGVNVLKYHSINVDCAKVQSFEVCKNYSPWWRNYRIKQEPMQAELYGNPVSFTQHWVATLVAGLYPVFSQVPHQIGSRPDPFGDYIFKHRLVPLISIGYGVLIAGLLAVAISYKRIIKNHLLRMLTAVTGVLVTTLFIFNYNTYLGLTKAYAVQVRYLFPLTLPLFVIFAFALNETIKNKWAKETIVLSTLLVYVWCGGVVGWIIRADSNWYWPNHTVIVMNQNAQKVLKKIVPN